MEEVKVVPHEVYYPFRSFQRDVNGLVHQIKQSEFKPDIIVGVGRGGLVPAVAISHALDLPMFPIEWSTRHEYKRKVIPSGLMHQIHQGKNVLIVDDIIDSGTSAKEIIDDMSEYAVTYWCMVLNTQRVRLASLFHNSESGIKVDFTARSIRRSVYPHWIKFWWEQINDPNGGWYIL